MLCVGIGSCKRGFHIHYPRVCPVTRHVDVHFLAILAFHFPVFPSWSFSILLCFYLLHSRYCFLSLLSLHTEKGGRENRLSLPTSHSLPPLLSVPLALVPHPSQFIILTWCYLTPLSLSLLPSYWMLCFHYCIIHHSDLCVLWYPGVCGWNCVFALPRWCKFACGRSL